LAAALTPGQADDREVERARRRDEAMKAYNNRLAPLREQYDKLYSNLSPAEREDLISKADLGQAAGRELDATNAKIAQDTKMGQLQEWLRLRQVESQTEEMRIRASTKGMEQEIALLKEKALLERNAVEVKLQDPTLDPGERQALEDKLRLMDKATEQSAADIKSKWGAAAEQARLGLQSEIAKGTKTGLDDARAEYELTLQGIAEAEAKARAELAGPQLANTLARYQAQRLNAERDLQKKLRDLWAQEFSEKLTQQKTLIQEQLELDSQAIEASIRTAQDKMRPLQEAMAQLQRQLDESARKRDAEKRPYQAGDGKRNTKWAADLAALNADPFAWAGVQEIANTATHAGLSTVSGATAREGLLKEAALQELEANNMVSDERITEEQFKLRMQKVQLLRAKAAEMELATADLTRTRKLELEKEWAEAYASWQQFATDAIDARYDETDQRTRDSMDLKAQEIQQQQDAIDVLQKQLEALQRAAAEKIRPIDDELKKVEKTTRDWGKAWKDVTAGIEAARKAAEAFRDAQGVPPGGSAGSVAADIAAGNITVTSGSGALGRYDIDRTHKKDKPGYGVDGGDGWHYPSKAELDRARAAGLKGGAFIADSPRYAGDKAGPFWLDRKEAVVPFSQWPQILKPFMPAQRQAASFVFNPQISISGNTIVGEFDFYQTAYRAAGDLYRENAGRFAIDAGRLF
ncbi:MAG: hypothetical protein ACAI44_40850, partial [Candidatus Sericytochromatia bacterium]